MNFLLVEDDADKEHRIVNFLNAEYPGSTVKVARSLSSGLKAMIREASVVDFLLLDMSLPTYEVSQEEPLGGPFESFGGRELLAQMKLRGINIPTIVLTMFDAFGDGDRKVSLDNVAKDIASKYSPMYRGFVYYNAGQEGWRSALKRLIEKNRHS